MNFDILLNWFSTCIYFYSVVCCGQVQEDSTVRSGDESACGSNITDKDDSESSDSSLNEVQKAAIEKVNNL